MEFILANLFIFMFYFSLVGFLSVLESKVMGAIQSSSSMSSVGILSIYHFLLDFFKMFFKGVVCKVTFKMSFSSFLIFFIGILSIVSFMLPLSSIGYWCYYGFLFFLFVDGSFFLFKMTFSSFFSFKFMNFTFSKLKSLYSFNEGVIFLMSFLVFISMSSLGVSNYQGSVEVKVNILVSSLVLFLFLLELSVKFLSVPCDYLEVESEFVGGLVLELHGLLFVFWSLVEYLSIMNNIMFLCSLFLLVFGNSWLYWVFLTMGVWAYVLVLFSMSALLMSVSFKSYFFIISKMFSMILMCLFFVLLLFYL